MVGTYKKVGLSRELHGEYAAGPPERYKSPTPRTLLKKRSYLLGLLQWTHGDCQIGNESRPLPKFRGTNDDSNVFAGASHSPFLNKRVINGVWAGTTMSLIIDVEDRSLGGIMSSYANGLRALLTNLSPGCIYFPTVSPSRPETCSFCICPPSIWFISIGRPGGEE